jgi:hypothetical protein
MVPHLEDLRQNERRVITLAHTWRGVQRSLTQSAEGGKAMSMKIWRCGGVEMWLQRDRCHHEHRCRLRAPETSTDYIMR